MTSARTVGVLLLFVCLFVPYSARAALDVTVSNSTIYPSATIGSSLATTTTITASSSIAAVVTMTIQDATSAIVCKLYQSSGAVKNPNPLVWAGLAGTTFSNHCKTGTPLPNGAYTLVVTAASSTISSYATSTAALTISDPPSFTPPVFPQQTYTFPIAVGWNLLSVPIVPSDSSVADIFASSSVDAVWSYDPSNPLAGASGWFVYAPAHPELSNLTAMEPGEGYFVHASTTESLSVTGSLFAPGVTPPARQLAEGWNLVGSYANSSESIDDAFSSIGWAGLEYTALWKLDATSKSFVLPSQVQPGDAFWILLTAPQIYAPTNL